MYVEGGAKSQYWQLHDLTSNEGTFLNVGESAKDALTFSTVIPKLHAQVGQVAYKVTSI